MTTGRTAPGWLAASALVALLPVTLLVPLLDPGSGTWWPASGIAAAALLLGPRPLRWPLVVAMVVLVAPLVSLTYDAALPRAAAGTLIFVVPALLLAELLRPRADSDPDWPIAGFAGPRYHVVVLLSSALSGLLAGVVVLTAGDALADAAQWTAAASLSALTSILLVMPLLVTTARVPGVASAVERWSQRVLLVTTTGLLLVDAAPVALTTVAFPLLGWAALRLTRREAHLQLCAYSVAVYVLATIRVAATIGDRAGGLPAPLQTLGLHLFLASLCLLVGPLALAVERLSLSRSAAVRSEATVQRMLDSAGSTMLLATDVEGRIVHFNEGASRLLGYAADEVVGQLPDLLHTSQEVARHATALGVAADLGSVVDRQVETGERRDWELVHADGSRRMISIGFNVVRDPDDTVVLILASGDDVTDRLRAQHALETALDREHSSVLRLQEVDHVKQELISNVSHELRTPITSIAGYTELLSDSSLGELTRPQHDALMRIERNAQRLQALVDDLLTMSRAESGRLQLSRTRLDLAEVVRGAWELFEEQLRHRDLEAVLVLPPGPVAVLGDHGALERVVVNLVSNAVKFTPDGGSITLALTRSPGDCARLVVRDTGIGIPPADQAKLFTRFFRSQQATEQAIQGTGLGLSIVQTLVAQHGGHVSVRSRPGEGTRVTVELPVEPVAV